MPQKYFYDFYKIKLHLYNYDPKLFVEICFYTLTCIPIFCYFTFDDRIIRACNLIRFKEMIIVV